jgi:uncharacterized SAM-binding protein YcdF (DUF218 family)
MTQGHRLTRLLLAPVLLALGLTAIACWTAGFLWFAKTTRRLDPPPPPHTDGIVALTGGAGRVELALRLLADNQADKLLLSGIGGKTELATLGRLAGVDTVPLVTRITMGRYAASTRGNGVEAAAWAQQNHITSLIVVTAAFHMPRALSELRQALPHTRLFPLPVRPTAENGAFENDVGLRLEAEEYTKYLLTAAGLSAWFPRREPLTTAGIHVGAGG